MTKLTEENMLVEKNIGLVYMVAKKFTGRGIDFEDIVQIGSVGLIKASKKFNSEIGTKFSTYAVSLIIGEIKRFFRDDGIIKIPRKTKETAIKVKFAIDALYKKNGIEPRLDEICEYTGFDKEIVVEALEASVPVESIYSETKNETYILDTLYVNDQQDIKIEDEMFLKDAIEKLDERLKQIVKLRFFKQKTQSEIADMMGVSQVQISRLEKKAILLMRQMFKD